MSELIRFIELDGAAVLVNGGRIGAINVEAEGIFPGAAQGDAVPQVLVPALAEAEGEGIVIALNEQEQVFVGVIPCQEGIALTLRRMVARFIPPEELLEDVQIRTIVQQMNVLQEKGLDPERLKNNPEYRENCTKLSHHNYMLLNKLEYRGMIGSLAGEQRLRPLDLTWIYEEVCSSIDDVSEHLGVKFEWESGAGNMICLAKQELFQSALYYLLRWAIARAQHSEKKLVRARMSIKNKHMICLRVSTSSGNLSMQEIEEIFLGSRSDQLRPNRNSEHSIAITSHVVTRFGGYTWVKNEEDEAAVYVYLPLADFNGGVLRDTDAPRREIPSVRLYLAELLAHKAYDPLLFDDILIQ